MNRVNLSQGSAEWHAWRRDRLGGSDIAAVIGVSPFDGHTRESVFAAKVRGVERPQNGAMYRGTVLEPWARDLYQRRFRVTAAPACVEMDGCAWAAASLDGLCASGAAIPSGRVEWLLEIKCPGWELHSRTLMGVDPPDYYACQVQWQMLVAGVGACDFATFNPSARFTPARATPWEEWRSLSSLAREENPPPEDWLAVVRVEADEEYQAHLLSEAALFWFGVEAALFWFGVEEARAALRERAPTP